MSRVALEGFYLADVAFLHPSSLSIFPTPADSIIILIFISIITYIINSVIIHPTHCA